MKAPALFASVLLGATLLGGCSAAVPVSQEGPSSPDVPSAEAPTTNLAPIDMTAWNYDADADAYWQVGISYCENPADASYETMGIYVPGAYLDATDNGDGTFTCTVNTERSVEGFTAETAPIVIPVDTPGYMAQAAPTGYAANTADYTSAGFVYVSPGCRGRDAGAPAGVTDLKAAIRYTRYNAGVIPGDMDRIFSFGMSGGGAQSALLGASGDSALYEPYLEAIGAVSGVSDAVSGSMCWCPVTALDIADEAYEWNMGSTRADLDEETQQLSDAMAERFAEFVNDLGLTDTEGNVLTLEPSDEGIYQAGSYYDYLKDVVEGSLNDFLAATAFPYTVQSGKGGFGGRGGDRGGDLPDLPEGELPEGADRGARGGDLPDFNGAPPAGDVESMPGGRDAGGKGAAGGKGGELPDLPDDVATDDLGPGAIEDVDGIARNEATGGVAISGTYDTVQDYIDALNANGEWVSYDPATNTATITSIADFAQALKNASKNVGAFDDLNRTQGENVLFGTGDGQGAHFDPLMAELLEGTEYAADFSADLARTDALGNSMEYRTNMYNPMYYLDDYYEGFQTSEIAKYWRIRSGINQGDTALSTEVNLALALEACGADVDFATVWGQAHVEAELEGDSTENFIAWVKECCQQ